MNREERQKHLEFLNDLVKEKRNFTVEQEKLINNSIFNILCSESIMQRYSSSKFGSIKNNNTVSIYDCINYFANKLKGE